ncbi:MAG: hypothetical protein P4L79_03435 [Legionella sp.]|uniref:hypothetical protein n=1 Tax=Legionella sp. TaxID=459 RepID=UPI00284F9B68|nr:hypothetical protein [Legionella sp.]
MLKMPYQYCVYFLNQIKTGFIAKNVGDEATHFSMLDSYAVPVLQQRNTGNYLIISSAMPLL